MSAHPESASPALAHVHVDLDGLWTLASSYGYPEGESFTEDPVFTRGLPRLLDLLERRGIRATFFIVGRDLELPEKRERVKEIAARGHELAHHSYHHALGLEDLDAEALREEIARTSDALEALAGRRPVGFRAPGYAAGPRLLTELCRAGFRYDGSLFPTWTAPLLRWAAGRLRAQVRRELGDRATPVAGGRQYGSAECAREYTRRVRNARVSTRGACGVKHGELEMFVSAEAGLTPLMRLPVAVSPVLRLPIHASLGILLGERFVRASLRRLARRGGGPIVYLLHGMDALGPEDLAGRLPQALARTRPFQIPIEARLEFLNGVLGELKGTSARIQLSGETY